MMKDSRYERVHSSRLYEDVATQIEHDIVDGRLVPGDRLPPEHELGEQFGVSRTVVREAIQSLRSRGLVEVVQGSGMFVTEPRADAIVEALSTLFQFRGTAPYALHEVREILEIEIAGLAAERATERDRAELLKALEWMRDTKSSPRRYVEMDLLFHTILARAAKNEVILVLLQPLIDLLRQSRLLAIQAPEGIERSCRGHEAIYAQVLAGDRTGARAAMREHLGEVKERLAVVQEAVTSA